MTAPQNADSSSLILHLWYGEFLVAKVSNIVVHQGTWFGDYRQVVTLEQGKRATLLCDFIVFVENWHKRLEQGENPDPNQFERFKEVLYSGLWHGKNAPMAVSWQLMEPPVSLQAKFAGIIPRVNRVGRKRLGSSCAD